MDPERPTRLIDPESGEVTLHLFPYHLDRLHGPWPRELARDDAATRSGLPFPLRPDATPEILRLRGGMRPSEMRPPSGLEENSSLGATSWQRFHAYALTPFGWVPFPTPFFKSLRLQSLSLNPYGSSETAKFRSMEEWLEKELGGPGERKVAKTVWPFNPPDPSRNEQRLWRFAWGHVGIAYEPRDWTAEMGIVWSAP